jgi:hypothetical protein
MARSTRNSKLEKKNTKNENDPRTRRSTANRILTVIKAALNHAYHDGKVATDDAWRKVKEM